jgi:hypothetical protein
MRPRAKQFASQFPSQRASWCSVLLMLCAGQLGLAQQSTPMKPSVEQTATTASAPAAAANDLVATSQAASASAATPPPALSSLGLRNSLKSPAFKEVSETEDASLPNGAT